MDIPTRANGGGLVGMNEAVGTLYDQVEAWAREPLDFGEVRGLATEIPSLDQLLGGLQPGWLVLICARPMIGKSALAFEIARRNAEKARRVAIFSLEMPRNDILLRWASCLSGVETRKVRRGPCPGKYRGTPSASAYLTEREFSAYIEAMGKISAYPSMWIDDTGALSALDIRARAIRLAHQAGGLDLVIVDHSGLMIGDGQNGEGVSKVEGRKSNAMRALAKEIGCPVILIQQLNRGVEARSDKRPDLASLRDSGEHEQNAHVVIGLYRESAYKQMLPGTTDDLSLEALTLKHREGPSGKRVTLRYERNLHRFGEFVKGASHHAI
jgi:replicative DNA helicase